MSGAEGSMPMDSFAPQQGVDGGSVAGTPNPEMAPSPLEQNAGIFSMFEEIAMGVKNTNEFLMTLAGQFPGASEPIRRVLEAFGAAEKGLVDVIQAVSVEATQPTPTAPRTGY